VTFCIDCTGRPDTLACDDLEASAPARRPPSTTDVAAVQSHRHRRSWFRQRLDVSLATRIVGELFGAKLGFEPLGCYEHMLADSIAVKTHIDGKHVVHQIGHRRK
jgi:hypothetical protein